MKQDKKIIALALIKEGELSSKEIAEKSGVGYATILKYKRESNVSLLEDTEVDVLADLVKENLPTVPVTTLAKLSVHEKLSVELNEVAISLVNRIRSLSLAATEPEDITSLTKAISSLQTAFFSKPGTNVAILNSNGEPSSSSFKLFSGLKRD